MSCDAEKKSPLYHEDIFEYKGLKFQIEFEPESGANAPWDWSDGHGPVSEWRRLNTKRPGERVLCEDRGMARFYDFREALEIAKTRWGVGSSEGKTQEQRAVEVVEKDFEYLRGWCNNKWQYVSVFVTLLDENEQETSYEKSLGMIESNQYDYLTETAYNLADDICYTLNKDNVRDKESFKMTMQVALDAAWAAAEAAYLASPEDPCVREVMAAIKTARKALYSKGTENA